MPLLALIPYIQVPIVNLGPVVLDPWAVMVCTGFILGLEVVRARGIRLGLDVRDIVDGAVFTVGCGFLFGHAFHVAAYHPEMIDKNGWLELLRVWGGFSSTGGLLGAAIGAPLFYKVIRKRPFWIHADTIMFGFPFAWMFGRTGCFLAHDHIGRKTDFFLAVDYPASMGGPRHDLGLDEALWTACIALVFVALRNRPFRPGFFVSLFMIMYAPVRFLFDFLRNTDLPNADVRWHGLTPAQYGVAVLFVVAMVLRPRGDGPDLVDPRKAALPPASPPAPPVEPG